MNEMIINESDIQNKIFTIRGVQVMIDRDLAELYQVETKVLNQAVKRNIKRFPESFRFQLTLEEKNELVTNCDRFKTWKHSSSLPYTFTEQGVSMLSAVLKSDVAIEVSIYTHSISKQLKLDLDKYNAQYRPITVKPFKDAHDRFMILDENDVYHIGASLKDLDEKWFAFSKMERGSLEMLGRLG